MRGRNRYCLHPYMRGFDTFGVGFTVSRFRAHESCGRNTWLQVDNSFSPRTAQLAEISWLFCPVCSKSAQELRSNNHYAAHVRGCDGLSVSFRFGIPGAAITRPLNWRDRQGRFPPPRRFALISGDASFGSPRDQIRHVGKAHFLVSCSFISRRMLKPCSRERLHFLCHINSVCPMAHAVPCCSRCLWHS